MNSEQFNETLEALDDRHYQAILEGAALVMQDDIALVLGRSEQAFVIFELGEERFESVSALKRSLMDRSEALIAEYYQFNPISKHHFNQQLNRLIETQGARAFVQLPSAEADLKLFVDQGVLVAEGGDSPRFKYGIGLALSEQYPSQAIENKVKNWLSSGNAYGDYISVNVCRFSSLDAA